jgi:hypothetical protein
VLTAPFLVFRTRWLAVASGLALAALVFADLTVANVNTFRHPLQDAPACYRQNAAALDVAEEQALGARVYVSADPLDVGLSGNLGMVSPLRLADAFGIPYAADQAAWRRRALLGIVPPTSAAKEPAQAQPDVHAARRLLDLMAVRVVLTSAESDLDGLLADVSETRRRAADNVTLWVNDHALPRAYWVPRKRTVDNAEEALDILCNPAFDAGREVVVQRDVAAPELASPTPDSQPPATSLTRAAAPPSEAAASPPLVLAKVEDIAPEKTVLHVNAPEAGIVVLADTFAPGWQATLDGQPCPILKANGLFRGVAVSQGPHDIFFQYRPIPFLIGSTLTIATLSCLALCAVIHLIRGA